MKKSTALLPLLVLLLLATLSRGQAADEDYEALRKLVPRRNEQYDALRKLVKDLGLEFKDSSQPPATDLRWMSWINTKMVPPPAGGETAKVSFRVKMTEEEARTHTDRIINTTDAKDTFDFVTGKAAFVFDAFPQSCKDDQGYHPTGTARVVFRCGNLEAYVSLYKASNQLLNAGTPDEARIEEERIQAATREAAKAYATKVAEAMGSTGGCQTAASASGLEAFDTNSQFNEYHYNFFKMDLKQFAEQNGAASLKTERKGTSADGVSILILKSQFEKEGKAVFTLNGNDALGSLHALGTNPWAEHGDARIEVDTVRTFIPGPGTSTFREGYWVFAAYKPPRDFGRHNGDREFTVKLTFSPKDGTPDKTTQCTLKLVRPPLVLVHGTYDNPKNCYRTPLNHGGYVTTMTERLLALGIHEIPPKIGPTTGWVGSSFSVVDWEKTSGMKDPSDFVTNQKMVWENAGGIKDAIEAYRRMGLAATQADLVCHSQGGVVARVYARGRPLDEKAPPDHVAADADHLTLKLPYRCGVNGDCWYHRDDNYFRGDYHKLITLSTTHMGSDLCRLLTAYKNYTNAHDSQAPFTVYVQAILDIVNRDNAVYTGSFVDQVPGSYALRKIGATVAPAHAIACVAADEDLPTVDDGYYQKRMSMTWDKSHASVLQWVFNDLKQPNDARSMVKLSNDEEEIAAQIKTATTDPQREDRVAELKNLKFKHAAALRAAAFGHRPNDCTVRLESSLGGLSGTQTTIMEHRLHGYAPRYKDVQDEVLRLLDAPLAGGNAFSLPGFPDAFVPGGAWDSGPGKSNDGPPVSSDTLETSNAAPGAGSGGSFDKPGLSGITGDVKWQEPGGDWQQASGTMALAPDSSVQTGPASGVTLSFPQGQTITLRANTQLGWDDTRSPLLIDGEVRVAGGQEGKASRNAPIKTPNATILEVGTIYTVRYEKSRQTTTVSVEEGRVVVTPADDSFSPAIVRAGQQARVTPDTISPVTSSSPVPLVTVRPDFGEMRLTQDGTRLTGTYTLQDGSILGIVTGDIVRFKWSQRGNGHKGAGRFTLSEDGNSFTGQWTYGEDPDAPGSGWNGKRTEPAEMNATANQGVITLRDGETLESLPPDDATITMVIEVPANKLITRTGIILKPGMVVQIKASGKIDASSATDSREYYHNVPPEGRKEKLNQFPRPDLPGLCLLGKRGANPFKFIGAGGRYVITDKMGSGELVFGINDDDVSDNSGEWTVQVTIVAPTEIETK